jgi:anti-sigma regulatory factor (Ser/Thr protein kinase)
MTKLRLSQQFPARLVAFREIETLLQQFGTEAALGHDDGLRLRLIVEELFTNTVRHGYGGDSDELVRMTLELAGERVALTYEDNARPYNPLAAAHNADTASPLEHRPVGGLGMLLTVTLCQEASYSFENGCNRVELLLARGKLGLP